MLINPSNNNIDMALEDISLKLGVSKEVLILIAVEAALIAAAALVGAPAKKIAKVPF